jgi:hypothetical protein
MLAGLKTQRTRCVQRPHELYRYGKGFFADALNETLACLPEHLWKARRHKRTYVNQVLARAEVHSAYLPARRLWVRTANGHYLPNPKLQLRTHASSVNVQAWRPVYDVLNLVWVYSRHLRSGWAGPGVERRRRCDFVARAAQGR